MRVRALLRVAALLLVTAVSTPAVMPPAHAQQRLTRFFVDSVADSTFSFRTGDARWVRAGQTGIAVDPRERDALVARFRVVEVVGNRATALITGQTTFLTGEHAALMEQPETPFWRRRSFWSGSAVGVLLGLVAGLSF